MSPHDREGRVAVPGGEVWYRIAGDGPGLPLLLLHGGPGAGHDYLEPLLALGGERPVVVWDQLGCGRSPAPGADPALWRIERFVEEVAAVREALGLERAHLLGQSWGGWLLVEYLLTRPAGVEGVVLASTSASIPQFVREAEALKAGLGAETHALMRAAEASGTIDDPAYEEAVLRFYRRHLCRLDPWPDAFLRTVANLDGNAVYETMNGPNEFLVVGNLRDWDRSARLGEIDHPTLVTVGRHDEITPACAATLREGIAGAELRLFEESSHTAHLEEPAAYRAAVAEFLAGVERTG